MTVKPLTEHNLEFLSLKGGCTGSPESTLVKMPYFWKSLSYYNTTRTNATHKPVHEILVLIAYVICKSSGDTQSRDVDEGSGQNVGI